MIFDNLASVLIASMKEQFFRGSDSAFATVGTGMGMQSEKYLLIPFLISRSF